MILALRLRLSKTISIRVDGQSSLRSLQNDTTMANLGISLVIGHSKNPNKNAPAEKAIRELRGEILNRSKRWSFIRRHPSSSHK